MMQGGPVLEVETRIQARPETIFAYFTDAERYRRWMGDLAELDPRPGGLYRVHIFGGRIAEGRYLSLEPPRRIVFSWGWVGSEEVPPGSTTVEVTLRTEGDVTIVRLEHVGLPTQAAYEQHRSGWHRYLDRLAVVGRGGDPGPDPLEDEDPAPARG